MSKTEKIITIGFAILCVAFLIVSIVNWVGFSISDTAISVQEGGYFDSAEALVQELTSGYMLKVLFWLCLSALHILRLVFFWKEEKKDERSR